MLNSRCSLSLRPKPKPRLPLLKRRLNSKSRTANPQPRTRRSYRPPKPQTLSIVGSPYLGKLDAPLTLVEFSDYQCPFCSRYVTQTLPQIVQTYVETGRLKYVQREFPLATLHPAAPKAAEAALCAGDQGKYWEMHDQLYKHQSQLGRGDLASHAKAIGLDTTDFEVCLDENKFAQQVQNDIEEGAKAGVESNA